MIVYFDLVLVINYIFDFLLLVSVSFILRRNASIKRIMLGAFIGSFSTLFLLIKISRNILFLYKLVLSILMVISTFGYKNTKYFIKNIIYLYLSSIVLGGGLYLINNEISLSNNGLLFINNGYKLSIILTVLISPIIVYIYIKQIKSIKYNYNNYHSVELYYKNKKYSFTAFYDTGNNLKDPYKKRPITIVRTDKINLSYEKSVLVPYETIDGIGILKCISVDKMIIDKELIVKKSLIGITDKDFNIDGVDMLLNNEIL